MSPDRRGTKMSKTAVSEQFIAFVSLRFYLYFYRFLSDSIFLASKCINFISSRLMVLVDEQKIKGY